MTMLDIKMPVVLSKPNLGEIAPLSEAASIGVLLEPYYKILVNQDSVLGTKGAGDFKIYQEVLRDDQVKSTFQQRRLAVVSKPWTVKAGAEDAASKAAAEALSANIQKISWDSITDKHLYGLFYGYSVAEVMWSVGNESGLVDIADIKVRDRARFRFNVNNDVFLLKQDYQFAPMPPRKFWVVNTGADNSDNPYGLGLAHYLYWPVFFKRNDIKFWLIFLEKFGQPTAVGKLPIGKEDDKTTRTKVLQALRAVATETGILLPDGAEVTLLEATRSGAADYEAMKNTMDAAIAKIVLSQTMTTDNGSSRSQSETHADVRDMVVKADADLICESFNNTVVKWWFEYNQAAFPNAKPPLLYRNIEPKTDLAKVAERDKKISELGYEPTEEYIKETYGDGWVKKQAQEVKIGLNPPLNKRNQNANFAENAAVELLKAAQNADQIELINAAQQFAENYEGILGQRVEQVLNYAEATQDYDTMKAHIVELMKELPPQPMVEKVERSNFVARLMGLFRGQK